MNKRRSLNWDASCREPSPERRYFWRSVVPSPPRTGRAAPSYDPQSEQSESFTDVFEPEPGVFSQVLRVKSLAAHTDFLHYATGGGISCQVMCEDAV